MQSQTLLQIISQYPELHPNPEAVHLLIALRDELQLREMRLMDVRRSAGDEGCYQEYTDAGYDLRATRNELACVRQQLGIWRAA
jgi:hypothetical protein